MAIYHFKIHTGDQVYAGTDSNIFIRLFGTRGESTEYRLNGHISGNAFERNQTDTCDIDVGDSCGDVFKIELRSDCRYGGSDWLLDYIEIKENGVANALNARFNICQWIKDTSTKTYLADNYSFGDTTPIIKKIEFVKNNIHVPSNTQSLVINATHKITAEVNYSQITTTEIGTSTKIGGEGSKSTGGTDKPTTNIKGTADFTLNTKFSVQKSLQTKIGEEISVSKTLTVTGAATSKTYEEVWTIIQYNIPVKVGSLALNIPITQGLEFSGLREVS